MAKNEGSNSSAPSRKPASRTYILPRTAGSGSHHWSTSQRCSGTSRRQSTLAASAAQKAGTPVHGPGKRHARPTMATVVVLGEVGRATAGSGFEPERSRHRNATTAWTGPGPAGHLCPRELLTKNPHLWADDNVPLMKNPGWCGNCPKHLKENQMHVSAALKRSGCVWGDTCMQAATLD